MIQHQPAFRNLILTAAFLATVPGFAFDGYRDPEAIRGFSLQPFLAMPGSSSSSDRGWDRALDPTGTLPIRFGVEIGGPDPFSRNSNELFKPASLAKYFTAMLALDYFGPEHRFQTQVQWNRASAKDPSSITQLTIFGAGDPTWGLSEFGETITTRVEKIAAHLAQSGVKQVVGPIEMKPADRRWGYLRYPDGWHRVDHSACYGALGQAFSLQGNCATLVITSASQAAWKEYGVPQLFRLDLEIGAENDFTVEEDPRAGFIVRGKVSSAGAVVYLPIRRLDLWIKNLFTRALSQRGIKLVPTPPATFDSANYSLTLSSPPLSEVVKLFLKFSVNYLGDSLLKLIAVQIDPNEDDLLSISQALLANQLNSLGAPSGVLLEDGSGLSHDNRITPRFLFDVLDRIRARPDFHLFWDALPIAGVDGTLINRMRGTAASGVLRAKTGTLSGAYQLAGFVPSENGYVPFVILTDTEGRYSAEARNAGDRVGIRLAEILRQAARNVP